MATEAVEVIGNDFDQHGYTVINSLLSEQQCNLLVKHLFELFEAKKMFKDDQCPISDAIYGDSLLDAVLQELANPLGEQAGRKLLPTYTYARIYRPGEVLKKHRDREACEISATVTLGFDAPDVWPIYFDDEKTIEVKLGTGDAALYKGCEVTHWRNEFKGTWHVQMFLHYVDAGGRHTDQYMDKRQAFGVAKNTVKVDAPNVLHIQNSRVFQKVDDKAFQDIKTEQRASSNVKVVYSGGGWSFDDNVQEHWAYWEKLFTPGECQQIIDIANTRHFETGMTGGGKVEMRKSDVVWLFPNDCKWVFERIAHVVKSLNERFFKFDIFGLMEGLQFTRYQSNDERYGRHVDAGPALASVRKLSFSMQLSDPQSYEGGDLLLHLSEQPTKMSREQGFVALFPSFTLHEVTPVTKGTRYSLVAWVTGKPFR